MTDGQKQQILYMRRQGAGYMKIARELGISYNTLKSYCRRTSLAKPERKAEAEPLDPCSEHFCQQCGIAVRQDPKRKLKKFCSDRCRMAWWNSHQDMVKRKANYEFTCARCGRSFISYGNKSRKYCCHECYIEDRFGGE